jgi:CHAD domain-containing protein/uncharacterized protein YjbK
MDVERELKLTLYGDAPDFSQIGTLGGRTLTPLGLEQQVNTYFDTPDFSLGRLRWALRIRALEGRSVVALKGPVEVVSGVHSREELEADIPAGADLDALPDGVVRERLFALTDPTRLQVIARIETGREEFKLDGVGELTLDRVRVRDRHDRVVLRFEEIELEMDGRIDAGEIARLEAEIQAISPVRQSAQSKLERALEAVTQQGRTHADTPWALAGSRVLTHELERLRAFEPMARAGLDAEGVHGMRVSIRRLRAALRVFNTILPGRASGLNDELGWLGVRLGAVRDLDVMLEGLPDHAGRAGLEAEDLSGVIKLLENDRVRAREIMIRTLDSRRCVRLLERLERLGQQWARLGARQNGAMTRQEGSTVIQRVYRRLRRDARLALADDAPIEALHELRKTAKRVRYTLEFLSSAVGETAEEAVAHLKSVQERLGAINDTSVALERYRALADRVRDVRSAFGLGVIVGRLEAELMAARTDFERAWRKFDPKAESKLLRDALEAA